MNIYYTGNGGNCSGCEWIAAEGKIVPGDDQKLAELMNRDHYGFVTFNSPGGDLATGIRMGRAIREAGYATNVGKTVDAGNYSDTVRGICASACAFAFLGGVSRYANGDEIGVHQFYDAEAIVRPNDKIFTAIDMSVNQYLDSLLIEYVMQMGVDYRFILKMSEIPPNDIYYLSNEELMNWDVSFDARDFGPWSLEAWKSGVIAFTKSKDEKTTVTAFCTSAKQPRILLTTAKINPSDHMSQVSEYVDYVNIFGLRVPADDIIIRHRGTSREMLFQFDGKSVSNFNFEDKRPSINAPAPNAYASYFYYDLTKNRAKEHIDIAWRNCIQEDLNR